MNKQTEKEWIIDADVVIENYNKKNPTLRKMTQGMLAEDCGVSAQRLSDWKRGQTVKAVQVLKKMAKIGDCQIEDFLKENKTKINS